MSRHYDAIVLGRSVGALATAALLARRDLRVLVLGQGQKPAEYRVDGRRLLRRSFTFLAGASPAWRRVLQELAQTPRFRRHTRALDPMFGFLTPGRRVEFPPELEPFGREIDREFPEVRQVVDELLSAVAHANASADAAFERDAVWPPGTFWERFETGRAAALLGLSRGDGQRDLLAKFPPDHAYRELVTLPAAFACDLAAPGEHLPPLALARLYGAWTRGLTALERGEAELAEFLVERVEAHGGECRLGGRAASVVVRRGAVAGVIEDGEDELTGASNVVTDQRGEYIADLAAGEGITPEAKRDWPRLTAASGRFVVSLRVKSAGLPAPLPAEAFLVPARGARPDPRRPSVHLQRHAALDGDTAQAYADESLLVAETCVSTRGPLTLLETREAVLAVLREQLPFLDRHLTLVDSPHDGLPAYDYGTGMRRDIDRIHVEGGAAGPEAMRWQWTVEPNGYLDVGGEPVRGPIPGTYLVGSSVLPGLGQEGEFLAALGAARLITKRDGTRQKMRRQMWSKIETS